MRIDELIGYKKDPAYKSAVELGYDSDPGNTAYGPDPVEPLSNRLRELGWELVGKGYEALVYSNPKKSYVIKLYIPGQYYERFLDFIMKNQHNPHVPKIIGKPVKLTGKSPVAMVRMEKLSPIDDDDDPIFLKYFPPGTSETGWEYMFDDVNQKWIKDHFPDLYQVINFIDNFSSPDLHAGNIMKRDDIPVFIDI